jgi:hypothetical protein
MPGRGTDPIAMWATWPIVYGHVAHRGIAFPITKKEASTTAIMSEICMQISDSTKRNSSGGALSNTQPILPTPQRFALGDISKALRHRAEDVRTASGTINTAIV